MAIRSDYDIIVVGAGLVGSALAKHLVKDNRGLRVVLIGQSEQKNKHSTDIHGAHYDKGRITAVIDPHPVRGILGTRSIQRFRGIEKESGISFYDEVGLLAAGNKDGEHIKTSKASAYAQTHALVKLSRSELCKRYPYMAFAKNDIGLLSERQSGYVDPRKLIKAQIKIAKGHGCEVVDVVVDGVDRGAGSGYNVRLANGKTVTADRVVLATGAFTFCRPLMPDNLVPKLCLYPNTVLLVEIDEEARNYMKDMPPIIYKGGRFEQRSKSFVAYILPPIQYDNGKYYMKLGHGFQTPKEKSLKTPRELHSWYCDGRRLDVEAELIAIAKDLFPDLRMNNYHFARCATAWTPTQVPYISLVNPSFGVALGACGGGAKCSDEMGFIAARMICKGRWDYDLSEEDFRFQSEPVTSVSYLTSKL